MSDPQSSRSPDRGRLLASLAILPVVNAGVAFVALPPVLQLGPQQAVAFAVLAGILGLLVMLSGALFPVGIGSCMGVISAWVFWFVAVHGTEVTR